MTGVLPVPVCAESVPPPSQQKHRRGGRRTQRQRNLLLVDDRPTALPGVDYLGWAAARYAPGMTDVTILHNNACTTSKHALAEAESSGAATQIVQYLKTPLDRTALLELIDKLQDPPADLVRKDPYFAQLGLDATDYVTPEAVADLIAANPRLMQRPVLIKGKRAIIGRPKDRVRPFLDAPETDA
jgi:arsenate reductase (glutaredoxin)